MTLRWVDAEYARWMVGMVAAVNDEEEATPGAGQGLSVRFSDVLPEGVDEEALIKGPASIVMHLVAELARSTDRSRAEVIRDLSAWAAAL